MRGTWVSEVSGSLLCLAYVGNCRSAKHLLMRSPGDFRQLGHAIREGNGTPLQYSCLENPMGGGAWWAAVYGVAQSRNRLMRLGGSSSSSRACYQVGVSPVDWAEHSRRSTGRVNQRSCYRTKRLSPTVHHIKVLQGDKDIIENEHFPIWKSSLQGKSIPQGGLGSGHGIEGELGNWGLNWPLI